MIDIIVFVLGVCGGLAVAIGLGYAFFHWSEHGSH